MVGRVFAVVSAGAQPSQQCVLVHNRLQSGGWCWCVGLVAVLLRFAGLHLQGLLDHPVGEGAK